MGRMFACCWSKRPKEKDVVVSSFEPTPFPQDIKLSEEQSRHAYSVAIATAAAAEAAVSAAHAAAEVVRLTSSAPRYAARSKEEISAVKVQSVFRGYLARRAFRALKGLVRLKKMMERTSVKRQSASTLHAMQSLTRMQAQIRSRRVRMTEENLALQRQLQLKNMKHLESLRIGGNWDDSTQSKEKLEANVVQKHEATLRRERALAYAFSHQQGWRNSSRSVNTSYINPMNPHWGWCWLERLTPSKTEKTSSRGGSGVDIVRAYALNKSSRGSSVHSTRSFSSVTKVEEDSRSLTSAKSEQMRRHSIATSSMRDDESLASTPSIPSYMAPTQSAKAKSRLSAPSGTAIADSAKKRLSFSASSRRLSGSPRVDGSLMKDFQEA